MRYSDPQCIRQTQEVPKLPGKIQDCFATWEVAQYMDILEELRFNPSL